MTSNPSVARRGRATAARALAAVVGGAVDSRKALEEQLGVSKATACRAVDQLLESGLLEEGDSLRSPGRGRTPTSLRAPADLGYVVGADLEGLAVRVCILDCGRNVLVSRRRSIGASWSIARILRTWRDLIADAVASVEVAPERWIGLGVALPGMAAAGEEGVRTYLPPGRLERFDVREELAEFGLPIVASDNTLCVSDYERRLGEARDAPSFLSVLVRYGIGATISSGGRFVVGEELLCGELGHMRVQLDGPTCVCGLRGCLDAFCSGRTWPAPSARRGARWETSLRERASYLGLGLGNLLKLVHSPLVLLNGVYNDYADSVREPIERAIEAELAPLGLATPRLAFGAPLEEKACIGAALRAVDRQMPSYLEERSAPGGRRASSSAR